MQILGLIALLAGIAKTAILFFSETRNKLTSAFTIVCISMILQNAFEFLVAVTYYTNPDLTARVFQAEMFSLILLAYCLLWFSLTVSENVYIKPISTLFGLFALVCTCLLLTGNLVQGYEHVGYTIISTPSRLYPVLNAYGMLTVATILLVLAYAARASRGELRTRSRQVCVSVLPICIVAVAVQLFKLQGYNASTAVFMPVATTFFLAMMVLYQSGRIVVFKIKWTIIWKLAVSMRDVKLSEWVGLVEELMVKEAMRESDNNQTEAAKLIKSSQTTVGRKFKKYGNGGREFS